jgi:hypothetical protein
MTNDFTAVQHLLATGQWPEGFVPLQDQEFELPKPRPVRNPDAYGRGILSGDLFPWEQDAK